MTKGDLSDHQCTRGATVQRNKNLTRHYYECTVRLFNDGRADDYLNEVFLNAAKNGDYERVQNFLARTSRNASVNVDAKDKFGFTAVMYAAMNEHRKVVSLLLNYGADITLCNDRGQSILDFAPDSMRPLLLGSVARQGYSPRHLLQAAWQGNLELVKKLLSSKSKSARLDVNCKNADGLTPLLLVTRDLNLFEKIERAVLENGYHPAEVVRELLHHNADCGAKDNEGKRPLHFAVHAKGSRARDVVDALIEEATSDIDTPDRFSNSPLHWATKEDNQPILLALIKGGANVNARGHIGKTPLHIAASHGYERASGTLLEHGADVTLTDDSGLSPVDVAKGRRVQVVLRDAWAEQTKKDKPKRIFSAPAIPPLEQDSAQANSELTELTQSEETTITRISTAPTQGTESRLKKRPSQSSLEDEVEHARANIPPSRRLSDVHMPRILSATKSDLAPGPRSSSGLILREQPGHKELVPGTKGTQFPSVVLPSLSVLNIELRDVRNLRGEKQEPFGKKRPSHLPLPPHYRLRHRLSSPVLTYQRKVSPPGTPEKDLRLRSASTSQVPNTRTALPSRVPPLGVNRGLTPELRSVPSLDVTQERISVTPQIVDLDLLRKIGLHGEGTFEVREVAPPPPSPRGLSRSSNTSQDDGKVEANQTQPGDGVDMTRTFTSIPRSTFWIPMEESGTKKNEESREKTSEESSSNGTTFYIDLKNLEALASGSCSLCGKSLPEGKPTARRDSIESSPDIELCKSCQPRRRSSEDVFWIPFTEKKKASALKSHIKKGNGEDNSKTNDRKKSNDENIEHGKLQETTNLEQRVPAQSNQTDSVPHAEADSKAVVASTIPRDTSILSPSPLRSVPSNLTGFDVSCVCDNVTGVCSCTIAKKGVVPSPPAAKESLVTNTSSSSNSLTVKGSRRTTDFADVVKTVGETSSVTESTLVTRPGNDFAVSTRPGSPSASKSGVRKESEIILESFSENDVYNPVAQEGENVGKDSSSETVRNSKERDTLSRVGRASTHVLPTSEALDDANKPAEEDPAPDPSPPKQAWTTPTPRSEETGAIGVRIVNPFPSPEPPKDRSAVHPPIGPVDDARVGNKKLAARKKVKKGATKHSNTSKNAKPRIKTKCQEQNGKGGKKIGKGKKKGGVKMITVQQREAGEELGLRTISQGGFSMPEDVPVPPTLSMDYLSTFRPFNARMIKGKHPVLSPIPESPRSKASTPRNADNPEKAKDNVEGNVAEHSKEEAAVKDLETSEGIVTEGDFDVVDGGIISKLKTIGMCVPRLQFGKPNTDSDDGSDTECNEPLIVQPQGSTVGDQEQLPVEVNTMGNTDGLKIQQAVQDEADDAMEEMIQRELSLRERREEDRTSLAQRSHSPSQASVVDSLTNVTSHESSSLSQTSEQSVVSYQYSRDFAPGLFESEFVILSDEAERRSLSSRTSSEMSSQSEQYSETDSSYNSCGSDSPRPLSPASSLNSSDTYFSSPRDSSCAETPTPDRDTYSENSVEMEYYERMAREKSGISSGSSSSSSTIRAQSNTSFGSVGNISQGSFGSFASVMSGNLVRSRLSASSRSQSSTSCEEEIVWKKGNVLGRGAFGTVWCGLTNTGGLIAVKQVELNHSNWEEAEEQYEKLQEEVSLLKSLKHENIVRFIGTSLDGGVVNIYMEYVPGGSIASILARFGCLDEPVFRRYTKQLLSGVSYIHGNNVIHRDIKGCNILIMPSGVLKLIDFGCAKRLYMNLSMSKSNILRSMKGTPYWMAPEVIRETGHGRKSDIWSVGCTVYEMATAKPPWSDMPPMAAIFAIGSGSLAIPQLSEDFSEGARNFVHKCLTRDPDLRPSADELLQHQFLRDLL